MLLVGLSQKVMKTEETNNAKVLVAHTEANSVDEGITGWTHAPPQSVEQLAKTIGATPFTFLPGVWEINIYPR